MEAFIKLTTAGNNTGSFELYSDVDNFTTAFETGVTKAQLVNGYTTALVPDYTTIIRVQSTGFCSNFTDFPLDCMCTTTTTTTIP